MYYAIKLANEVVENSSYKLTKEMIDASPHFDTEEEANKYADLISLDALWAIGPID